MEVANKYSLYDLEKVLSQLPQVDGPLEHYFADGIYIRQLRIPEDSIIIGKRHRHETCNILLKGTISIFMGRNLPAKKLVAPCIFNSKPMTKKMAYAHTDALFLNIHPTTETDFKKIEQEFIIPEDEYIELIKGDLQCLGQQ